MMWKNEDEDSIFCHILHDDDDDDDDVTGAESGDWLSKTPEFSYPALPALM